MNEIFGHKTIHRLLQSVEDALTTKNYYAALFVTLCLPDIAGDIEQIDRRSGDRYPVWFDKYIKSKYTHKIADGERCFLSGNDCYALRCALLHRGLDDISEQSAREVLKRFQFIEPPKLGNVHCNQNGKKLQLQVDIFCQDICNGIREWLQNVDFDKMSRLQQMIKIHKWPINI